MPCMDEEKVLARDRRAAAFLKLDFSRAAQVNLGR